VRGGVRCTLSTDSRTVAQTTLSDEYRIAHEVMGMTLAELRSCNQAAYDARFDPAPL
jgi:adenosine deaminase